MNGPSSDVPQSPSRTLNGPRRIPAIPCSTRPLALSKVESKLLRWRILTLEAGMQRREFIRLLRGAAASYPIATRAQQHSMRLIGLLTSTAQNDDRLKPVEH